MAVMPYDAVKEKAKRLLMRLAALALCAVILLLICLAAQLVSGFFGQVRGLVRQLFFDVAFL